MIYGCLAVVFVLYALFVRQKQPRIQATYDAVAGAALSGMAWLCHFSGFEPGPTPSWFKWDALALFALWTGQTLWTLLRTRPMSDDDLQDWRSSGIDLAFVGLSVFVVAVHELGYPLELAIIGGLLVLIIITVAGRRRA